MCGENPKAIVILIQEPSFSDPYAVHKPSSATTILWLVILWVGDAWGTVCPTVGAGSRGWQPVFSRYLDQLSHSMAVPSKADRAEATRGRPRPGPVSLLRHPAVQAGQEASDISRGREIGSSPARKGQVRGGVRGYRDPLAAHLLHKHVKQHVSFIRRCFAENFPYAGLYAT